LTSADRLLRAEIDHELGRDDAALAALGAIPDSDPLAAQARQLAGSIERQRGRMRYAEAFLREALRLDPELIQARGELVFIYGMQARRAELNEQVRELAARIPLDQSAVFLWTVSNVDIWVNETIRSDLESYLAADPGDRWSRLALAAVLLHQNELDAAEAALAPLAADDLEARALRGRIALDRSRPDEARALLAGAPEDHVGIACVRGKLASRAGDLAEAARQYGIAARLDPTRLEAAQGLALALGRLGRTEEAAEALDRAKRLRALSALLDRAHGSDGRKDRTLPRQLGAACEAIGRLAEAKAWYQIAVNLDPLDDQAQQALFRLREHPG
jgi:tetratricopeptide (TPR) repeat protein